LALFVSSEFKRQKIKGFAQSLANEAMAMIDAPLSNQNVGQGELQFDGQQMTDSDHSGHAETVATSPPAREQITDRGYPGPAICISSDGEIGGRITSYFEERDGEHWVNFQAFDSPYINAAVPLSELFEPHEVFDESLIDRWRILHNGPAR
jgi:hypothetical protein